MEGGKNKQREHTEDYYCAVEPQWLVWPHSKISGLHCWLNERSPCISVHGAETSLTTALTSVLHAARVCVCATTCPAEAQKWNVSTLRNTCAYEYCFAINTVHVILQYCIHRLVFHGDNTVDFPVFSKSHSSAASQAKAGSAGCFVCLSIFTRIMPHTPVWSCFQQEIQ